LYEEKKEKDAKKYIKDFGEGLQIINGPYGPYITNGKRNVKIPKDMDENKISEAQAKELLKQAPVRKAPPKRRKKAKK
jgi:DNA topoisomerase-1